MRDKDLKNMEIVELSRAKEESRALDVMDTRHSAPTDVIRDDSYKQSGKRAKKIKNIDPRGLEVDLAMVGASVLLDEADALREMAKKLDVNAKSDLGSRLIYAANICYHTDGKVIVIGVGKSGLIGRKIAATLASTGTPAFFVHPTEAMHGDLGMIESDDSIIAISYSGASSELLTLLPLLREKGCPIISITRCEKSQVAALCDVNIDIDIPFESGLLHAAPTTSTTLTLAVGDALAIMLMHMRGFKERDFASFHPGGQLGRNLYVKAKDLMQTTSLPVVAKDTQLKDALITMSEGALGCVIITDTGKRDGEILGILSDGDLRRAMLRQHFSIHERALTFATTKPKMISNENILAKEVLGFLEDNKITLAIITDEDAKLKGLLHMHRLVSAGIQ